MRGLHDRVAIVTGTTRQMGEAIALRLVQEGAIVIGTGRSQAEGEAAVRRLTDAGGRADFIPGDITRKTDVDHLVNFAHQRYGHVDIVVNNAAAVDAIRAGEEKRVGDESLDGLNRQIQVNLAGPFLLAKAVLPKMVESGRGTFVGVSAWNATRAVPAVTGYAAAKAAMEALDRQIARDYGPMGVRANSIAVGMIRVTANASMHDSDLGPQIRDKVQILPNVGEPEDIAAAVAFLASDDAKFITGTTLAVEGGAIMKGGFPADLFEKYIAGLGHGPRSDS
jgi:NAD(P)-dependent dehydrogenase (short-subunit alcohol dehydrogenase family)